MVAKLNNFFRYRGLLFELVNRDFKLQYRRSILGYVWSMLKPIMMMLVLTAVFSNVFRFSIDKFPVYLILGQTIFNFYQDATMYAMTSICFSGALTKKVYVPKYMFPLSKVCFAFVNMLCSLTAVVAIIIIYRVPLSWTMILTPLLFLYAFMIALGVALILSVLTVYFRDVIHLYGVFIMLQMYMTPLFYPVDILPESVYNIVQFNPVYHLVIYFRNIILYQTWPSLHDNMMCIMFSVLLVGLGLVLMKKNQDSFILYI